MLNLALPGFLELLPILVILVLLFGAKKLPELARAMGSSINMFKKGLAEADETTSELTEGERKDEGGGAKPETRQASVVGSKPSGGREGGTTSP